MHKLLDDAHKTRRPVLVLQKKRTDARDAADC